MNKLFSLILFFLSFNAFSFVNLPSHLGQEVQVWVLSPPIKGKNIQSGNWSVHVDVTSSALMKDTLFLTASARLGESLATVGLSGFYKINDFMFVGGALHGKTFVDYTKELTFLASFDINKGKDLVEPFIHLKLDKSAFSGGGFRYVRKKNMSFTIAAEIEATKEKDMVWHLMIGGSVVLKYLGFSGFGIVETLQKKLIDVEKNMEEHSEVIEDHQP